MKVSSSKFTFTLIAIAALLVWWIRSFMVQDASGAAGFHAPEFTCNHINTTATHCTFDQAVNGTLVIADWGIDVDGSRTAGDIDYTEYAISNIANSSSTGVGLTVPSAPDKRVSSTGLATGTGGLGFLNGTDFVLIHAAIPTDARYYVNYTNNPSMSNNQTSNAVTQTAAGNQGSGAIHTSGGVASLGAGTGGEGSSNNKFLKIGSNATAQDWIVPTATSAEILKSNPQQVRILMSETVGNVNSTYSEFSMTTSWWW